LQQKTKILVAIAAVTMLAGPAMAESVERPWKDPAAKTPAKPKNLIDSILPGKAVPAKPVVRKQQKASPARQVKKRRTAPAVKKAAKAEKRKKANKEAVWWETIGNPVVFAFRDCSTRFAAQQINAGKQAPAADLITRAMKSSCQVEFAKMAGVLIGGLGEEKSNAMLRELAVTTFLPPVQGVLASAQQKKQIQVERAQVKTSHANQVAAAKSEMFKCFVERTDRLSVAQSTSANTIAGAVIAGCKPQTDLFFDLLLANSKARPQVKMQQKNIALNETYRQAIVKRVLATRGKAQIKTATGTGQ
jgi:hypothetical protein